MPSKRCTRPHAPLREATPGTAEWAGLRMMAHEQRGVYDALVV